MSTESISSEIKIQNDALADEKGKAESETEMELQTKCNSLETQRVAAQTAEKQNRSAKQFEFKKIFKNCTGYESDNFTSYTNFTHWLHRPVDGSALGVFRLLYGLAMLIDVAEERGGSMLDRRFGDPSRCHFLLFERMPVLSLPMMGCVYLCMFLGALGITLGYRFRLSCLTFIIPYWYVFLLEKSTWNNHSYLFGLVGSLLCFTQANHYCSLDKWLNPQLSTEVPYWNYFLIKFQFFILYMYAGLKKFTAEWLSGYAMSTLSDHWLFTPFRMVLDAELVDLLIIHWFTAIFDFSIAFFMTCEKTRLLATPFMLSFHLMNTRLFTIGMFPWVCLAEVPIFFGFDWPRKLNFKQIKSIFGQENVETDKQMAVIQDGTSTDPKKLEPIKRDKQSFGAYLRTTLILAYCALQLFLPYSHFITKGYNNWTNGLYGYSWDMMVHSFETVSKSIKIVDNNRGDVYTIDPYAYTTYDRWTKSADMAYQYAKCIERNILADDARNQILAGKSALTKRNLSIYFDIWCSMNGRFQQRVYDPRVDLLKAKWSPFETTSWSLPLLNELNHMRPKLKTIAKEVLAWNNYSDVVFVADFPGLTLENHISADLTNVTLTILEGNVRFISEDEDEAYFLTAGKSIGLKNGVMHAITTIGLKPSSFLYTFVNKTMLEKNITIDEPAWDPNKPLIPFWTEVKHRLVNYKRFLTQITNCLLFLIYDVPIPMDLPVGDDD